MESNPMLDLAYHYVQDTHRNIFLTGKAGTGKTTFLRHIQTTTRKRAIVVAPTGVAAINAGGVTIHSFFQIAPGLYVPGKGMTGGAEGKNGFQFSKHKINILRSLDLLIIDEVSMVRCDLLDAIDEVLRRFQDRQKPFGGVQLLLIGDMQQLAPVATDAEWAVLREYYKTPYFLDSRALAVTSYVTIELTKVYRQADVDFVALLNAVRDNRLDTATLARLNARYRPGFQPDDEEGYITLTTHNYQAQDINRARLATLDGTPRTYTAAVKGDFPAMSYPTDEQLTLKVGAQVMFCKNDTALEKRYYNGRIGRVVALSKEGVTVVCPPDNLSGNSEAVEITVTPQEWTNTKYTTDAATGIINEEIAGTFTQIPLKTAWAITIHKSQGLTFDRAIIDAGRAFSHGQVYVALSRCRTLEGLVLSTPITPDVLIPDTHIDRFNAFVEQNRPSAAQLKADEHQNVTEILCDLFDYTALSRRLDYFARLADERLSRTYPRYVAAWQKAAIDVRREMTDVGLRFQQQIRAVAAAAENPEADTVLRERVVKGFAYYKGQLNTQLSNLIEQPLPDIDNAKDCKQLEREKELLRSDYELKKAFCTRMAHGFSLNAYWDVKATALMQQSEGTTKGKKKKRATARPSATERNYAAERTPQPDTADVLYPKLYEKLRLWRMRKADKENIPPYVIAHNRLLIAIANRVPQTPKDLLAIPDFGEKKLRSYGKDLLRIIYDYLDENGENT